MKPLDESRPTLKRVLLLNIIGWLLMLLLILLAPRLAPHLVAAQPFTSALMSRHNPVSDPTCAVSSFRAVPGHCPTTSVEIVN